MILLHVVVATLYGYAAWVLWPTLPAPAHDGAAEVSALKPTPEHAAWLMPLALVFHAWLLSRDMATPEGLDMSLDHALSVVAGLVAALAWLSGLMRTLPAIGSVVLPIAAVASVLPAFVTHPHRIAMEPWAALHVAIALIAYALFIVAALQALVLMGLEKRLRRHPTDPRADAMPPLLTLERFLFRLVAAGFVLLTLTVASGVLFSEELFGKPLSFNHKSLFSVLGWLTFGALLWGRWRYGWRGRVALRWILAGTGFLFLAYFGSKFVLEVLLGR